MVRRFARRDDPNPAVPFRKDNPQHPSSDHARNHEARFAVGQIQIGHLNGKSVAEYEPGCFEAYSMLSQVGFGLLGIPLKLQLAVHNSTDYQHEEQGATKVLVGSASSCPVFVAHHLSASR